MSYSDDALELFEKGYNCSQAICAVLGPDLGLSQEMCLAMSAPFGGGVARRGEVCGALSGGLLILGLRHGVKDLDPAALKESIYAQAQRFLDAFESKYGSLICRELLACDLRTPEGRKKFKENDLHHVVCVKLIHAVVELLEERSQGGLRFGNRSATGDHAA